MLDFLTVLLLTMIWLELREVHHTIVYDRS